MGERNKIIGLFFRYFLILLVGAGNLYIFYKVLTPLTVLSVGKTLSLFYDVSVAGELIVLSSKILEIIPACVAGSAFFLLFLLVFSTREIEPKKRILILLFSFASLFLLNYLRIILLVFISDKVYFEVIHYVFWHLVSIFFVVGIWLLSVKIFKIEAIPIYSDIKFLLRKERKERKRAKKN